MSHPASPPKALLFDVGGVCVLSPFQAILDYERAENIPPGWINSAISFSKPNGAWHRLERGEAELNARFFEDFRKDLGNPDLWRQHVERAIGKGAEPGPVNLPPVPQIDVEWLIDAILRISRNPDPYMYPALQRLKASGRFLVAALSNTMPLPEGHAAKEPHEHGDVWAMFDPCVRSAHYGVRKPEPRAYELAMELMRKTWEEQGRPGVLAPSDVAFLDDIGENVRQGRVFGFRTIKVKLGDTQQAVKDLERLTGMSLLDAGAKL